MLLVHVPVDLPRQSHEPQAQQHPHAANARHDEERHAEAVGPDARLLVDVRAPVESARDQLGERLLRLRDLLIVEVARELDGAQVRTDGGRNAASRKMRIDQNLGFKVLDPKIRKLGLEFRGMGL